MYIKKKKTTNFLVSLDMFLPEMHCWSQLPSNALERKQCPIKQWKKKEFTLWFVIDLSRWWYTDQSLSDMKSLLVWWQISTQGEITRVIWQTIPISCQRRSKQSGTGCHDVTADNSANNVIVGVTLWPSSCERRITRVPVTPTLYTVTPNKCAEDIQYCHQIQ